MQAIQHILDAAHRAPKGMIAVLVDPDKIGPENIGIADMSKKLTDSKVDLLLIGGSLMNDDSTNDVIASFKNHLEIPVIIFPGHPMQISAHADALMLLSLISGRNADLLISQHVHAAPILKKSGLESLSTGYMLIDGGRQTSVSYISNTMPIPADKDGIAVSTAMAGEMRGLKNLYLEAGSGALHPVPSSMINAVKQHTDVPLFVGGGIRSVADAQTAVQAGADIVVVGSVIEQEPHRLEELAKAVHETSKNQSNHQ